MSSKIIYRVDITKFWNGSVRNDWYELFTTKKKAETYSDKYQEHTETWSCRGSLDGDDDASAKVTYRKEISEVTVL